MKYQVTPDKQKAIALKLMAITTFSRLKEINTEKYPSNALTDYYDIIHKLIEALAIIEGVRIKGEGAHQELIDYVCKQKKLGEKNRLFLQQIRDYRNRISYEGFFIDNNFIESNKKTFDEIIETLLKFLDSEMS